MAKETYDICIIGAGASGIAAAIAAKNVQNDAKVILLEEKDKVGQKILATGNGRCNLSNRTIDPSHYGGDIERYKHLLGSYTDDLDFFKSLGLVLHEDTEGRIYPYSNQASSVLNAFLRKLTELKIETECNFKAVSFVKNGKGYVIRSEDGREVISHVVIVAVGTPAGKHNYRIPEILISSGETVKPFSPALAPLYVYPDVRQMKGTRVRAKATLLCGGQALADETGEVQIGDGYLSGICIMNLSRVIGNERGYMVVLDLIPDLPEVELDDYLTMMSTNSILLSELLSGILPKRIGEELMRACCPDVFKRKASSITDAEKEKVKKTLHTWTFAVKSIGPANQAQISIGGVTELDYRELESKHCRNVFYCGEVVNVDGKCGGYNLHWAWRSGITVGEAAAKRLRDNNE